MFRFWPFIFGTIVIIVMGCNLYNPVPSDAAKARWRGRQRERERNDPVVETRPAEEFSKRRTFWLLVNYTVNQRSAAHRGEREGRARESERARERESR